MSWRWVRHAWKDGEAAMNLPRGKAPAAGFVEDEGWRGESARVLLNRHELAGAFGDLGTDLPLLLGMILAAGLHASSVLIVFGCLQIVTGLWYRLPMPVQPLKAMAAIVIAQGVTPGVLYGGGLAVGCLMLILAVTGSLDALVRWLPKSVVRGVQLGVGLQLATVALTKFVQADGRVGYALAAAAFVLVLALIGNRRVPAALPVVVLGALYAAMFGPERVTLLRGFGLVLPEPRAVSVADIVAGAFLLALPQLPLSIANSVVATRQLVEDLFPERRLTARQIGFTYALMNLVAPWLGGVPVCHGSGGLAGHYAFGGRTGGSVVLYGAVFLFAGLLWGVGFEQLARSFPLPVLGILLLFEALALMSRIGDVAGDLPSLFTTLLVGVLCSSLPYGYVLGMIVGTAVTRLGWHDTWVQSSHR
ncbi:MAG: putative sulfate/molybdate transporter [Candidatus Binatia bacterium]|nr:putative sulfate/molybdate transporter [Candidatus Binatia bacterium]